MPKPVVSPATVLSFEGESEIIVRTVETDDERYLDLTLLPLPFENSPGGTGYRFRLDSEEVSVLRDVLKRWLKG
jgi:hypothetical protein